eukprot:gene1596-2232_t
MSGDNPFDSANPFNSGAYEANPFADAPGGGHSDGAQTSPSPVPAVNPDPVKQELERRTSELKRREDALTKGGAVARVKNFPKFYPIVYHSIEDDIPDDKQQTVKMCFYCYLGLVLCLFWNWFSATACMFAMGKTIDWLYACIYLLTGVPGACSMIAMFDENGIIGFFYLVGFFLWTAEAIFSTWVMKITYALFRGTGAEGELKAEAAKVAASQIV